MKKYSILVVDDEDLLRESLGHDLKLKGYNPTLVSNGSKAIEILENKEYDLVITDLIMESISGVDVLKAAKNKNSDAKVMILTGYGSLNSAIEALRLGAIDYMLKPYNRDEMFLRIAYSMERLELQRKVKVYESLLPVCCKCKSIRDDTGKEHGKGKWITVDEYLVEKTKVDVTHGICDKCKDEMLKEIKGIKKE